MEIKSNKVFSKLTINLIFTLCIIAYGVLFYPGFNTFDSMWMQMENAMSRPSGWHPILFQLILEKSAILTNSSNGMMLINLTLFWMVLIFWQKIDLKIKPHLQFILILSPLLIIFLCGIYKVTTASLCLILSWIVTQYYPDNWLARLKKTMLFFVLLFVGVSSRDEIIICSIPIIAAFYLKNNGRLFTLNVLIKTISTFAVLLFLVVSIRSYFKPYTAPKSHILAIYDLAHFSVYKNEILLPKSGLRPNLDIQKLKDYTDVGSYLPMVYHIYKYPSKYDEIYDIWFRTIFSNPLEYLRIRANIFLVTAGYEQNKYCATFDVAALGSHWGPDYRSNEFKGSVISWFTENINAWFFMPYIYLITLTILLLYFIFFKKNKDIKIILLGLSGIIQIAVMFFILSSCDRRYMFWPIIVTHIVLVSALSNLFEDLKKFKLYNYK